MQRGLVRRAVVVTSRLVVLLYELAVAGTVTALAVAAWKDDLYTTAVGGYLLALALTILGLVTVVRPMRAGFLQLTFNLGIGGFCLFSLIRRDFPLWFWPELSLALGSIGCLVLLDRVVWQAGRDELKRELKRTEAR